VAVPARRNDAGSIRLAGPPGARAAWIFKEISGFFLLIVLPHHIMNFQQRF
jgi:hypothetical protein